MTRKGEGNRRANTTGFKEVFLDPDCEFVFTKSAESDGIGSTVALEHFDSCDRCRSYHWVKARKMSPKLDSLTQQELDRLRQQRDEETQRKEKAQRIAKARMNLLLAYLDGEKVSEIQFGQFGIDQFHFFAEVILTTSDGLQVAIRASSNQEGYQYKLAGWPHWTSTPYTAASVIAAMSKELAKCQMDKEKRDGQG